MVGRLSEIARESGATTFAHREPEVPEAPFYTTELSCVENEAKSLVQSSNEDPVVMRLETAGVLSLS